MKPQKPRRKQKCQVAWCDVPATKRSRLSKLRYCKHHASMSHTYIIMNQRVPFRYDKIVEMIE